MLEAKKVVIIGGSSGIGLEVARHAIGQGAKVYLIARDQDRLHRAVSELGSKAEGHPADIGIPATLEKVFAKVGSFDHLVTTAANLVTKRFSELSEEEVQEALDSKVVGPLFAAQKALSHLAKNGSITFFSGLAAYRPSPGTVAVATVNAALEGLAKGLAVELAPIRVNVISPGLVDTPFWDHLPPTERKALFDSVANLVPVKRIGRPFDLAQAALFLMTNGFVTGTVVHVDGGGRLS